MELYRLAINGYTFQETGQKGAAEVGIAICKASPVVLQSRQEQITGRYFIWSVQLCLQSGFLGGQIIDPLSDGFHGDGAYLVKFDQTLDLPVQIPAGTL